MNTSGTTQNARVINAVKVNSISIWSPCTTSVLSASLEWISTYGPSKLISDTTVSATFPAVIHSKAPPQSLAGFWSTTGSNESDVMFAMTCPVGSVVDVNINFIVQDDLNTAGVTTTNNGSVGIVYYTYLDGPSGSADFQPIALPFLN